MNSTELYEDIRKHCVANADNATVKNEDGEGILDTLDEWQCPDPMAKVIFKIEEESAISYKEIQERKPL